MWNVISDMKAKPVKNAYFRVRNEKKGKNLSLKYKFRKKCLKIDAT